MRIHAFATLTWGRAPTDWQSEPWEVELSTRFFRGWWRWHSYHHDAGDGYLSRSYSWLGFELRIRHLTPAWYASGLTPAITQGTVAVDANGNVSFTVDFPSNASSYRYAVSTSAFPNDATTASGGALNNLGGLTQSTVTGVTTLTLGQTAFLTIVPFTGASGGGTQMQPIHIRGAYLTISRRGGAQREVPLGASPQTRLPPS